jgi:hypothetical protein
VWSPPIRGDRNRERNEQEQPGEPAGGENANEHCRHLHDFRIQCSGTPEKVASKVIPLALRVLSAVGSKTKLGFAYRTAG